MNASEFVAYVGPPDIHDSTITSVTRQGDSVRVELRTLDARPLSLTFQGVASIMSQHPEGMFLYALTELASPSPPLRRFVFANSDEESASALEVLAENFTSDTAADAPPKA
ncbi:MAG: hypothetical protein DME34_05725 [Verrucomicrobia bacterium]|nr:MAG: hypothetical protein DME34_05725 [Verrucomicrobiota bacterium]